jgi:peptide deformylase
MAQLPILSYPDPRLHTVAKPVAQVDDRIRTLVDDMIETMYEAKGVGLAATQVDVHERRAQPTPCPHQPRDHLAQR